MHPRSDYKQLYRCNVTAHTSFFQEVEWPQEATGSGDFRLTVSRQLGKLVTRQVYESGDVAEDQIREDLRVLMSQSFHKEVRVEDHWLACIWFLHAGKHTALRLPAENTSGIKVFFKGSTHGVKLKMELFWKKARTWADVSHTNSCCASCADGRFNL